MSLVMQFHNRSKAFHADIARKAAMLCPAQDRSYSIPNTPFGVKKVEPQRKAVPVPRNPEPDYWHQMWFFDLVFGKAISTSAAPKVEDIIRAVCHEFGVSKIDLIGCRRNREIVRPRQVAMYLAKKVTGRSLPEIGRRMGGRDHTTALAAIRRIEELVKTDAALAAKVTNLVEKFNGGET